MKNTKSKAASKSSVSRKSKTGSKSSVSRKSKTGSKSSVSKKSKTGSKSSVSRKSKTAKNGSVSKRSKIDSTITSTSNNHLRKVVEMLNKKGYPSQVDGDELSINAFPSIYFCGEINNLTFLSLPEGFIFDQIGENFYLLPEGSRKEDHIEDTSSSMLCLLEWAKGLRNARGFYVELDVPRNTDPIEFFYYEIQDEFEVVEFDCVYSSEFGDDYEDTLTFIQIVSPEMAKPLERLVISFGEDHKVLATVSEVDRWFYMG